MVNRRTQWKSSANNNNARPGTPSAGTNQAPGNDSTADPTKEEFSSSRTSTLSNNKVGEGKEEQEQDSEHEDEKELPFDLEMGRFPMVESTDQGLIIRVAVPFTL